MTSSQALYSSVFYSHVQRELCFTDTTSRIDMMSPSNYSSSEIREERLK